ncbi:hypothetical protein SDC9_66709 [bioreactor metagenome]|uniref:Uncharacterized protein n=1 Tax=bioreactor metagenome TaxID=1076179 RepID=A0A644XVP7_9ZZZZ
MGAPCQLFRPARSPKLLPSACPACCNARAHGWSADCGSARGWSWPSGAMAMTSLPIAARGTTRCRSISRAARGRGSRVIRACAAARGATACFRHSTKPAGWCATRCSFCTSTCRTAPGRSAWCGCWMPNRAHTRSRPPSMRMTTALPTGRFASRGLIGAAVKAC